MALSMDILLPAGRYDAGGGQDPRAVEWPPHPARVLAALRSVATDEDLPTLRALECLPAPHIYASDLVGESRTRTFVVTNTTEAKGGNLSHPARTSGLRERRSAFPLSPQVHMLWAVDDHISDEEVSSLDRLARRVPYLGRSTSVVLMGFRRAEPDLPRPGLELYVPSGHPTSVTLRVPYDGYTDELSELFTAGQRAWQASDGGRGRQAYRHYPDGVVVAPPAEETVWRSPYQDLVVLRITDQRPSGRLTTRFTKALRSKVMSQTADPLPPALHGHGIDSQPHVAYLALPFAGYDRADGHLVGLAVAVPGLPANERRAILRGLLGPNPVEPVLLQVPGLQTSVSLRYEPDTWRPYSARPERWSGVSRTWVTVTPIVLDHFPKRGDLHAEVARSLTAAGYPPPESIDVSRQPLTPGGIALTPNDLPKRAQGRIYCHARVTFSQPVAGPVLAGAGRYFGVGLFAPESNQEGTS